MKKMRMLFFVLAILCLAGCNSNKNVDSNNPVENTNNSVIEENNKQESEEKLIILNYTNLKNQNLLPVEPQTGEYYDIGKIKLGNNKYDLRYVVETKEGLNPEDENAINILEKLKFYENGSEKMELLVGTDLWCGEYIDELSIFNNKYLVTISNTNTGDTMQFLEIYDENLEKVTDYGDNSIIEGSVSVHKDYENYYIIGENEIVCIDTVHDFEGDLDYKVVRKISEENGNFKIEVTEKTTEGALGQAGRT